MRLDCPDLRRSVHLGRSAKWLSLLAAAPLAVLLSSVAVAAEHDAAWHAARQSITAKELGSAVEYLADDKLKGRLPGTEGSRLAAKYLRDQLAEMGLQPAGPEGSFYQPFDPEYRNVLAKLPGRDAELRDEVIVVGAHYDHVGHGSESTSRGGVGEIHNGADDNASGTSAVLELAEAFATLPRPPRRTLLFALWDAEELGFHGSLHFVEHPTVPLEKIVMAINFDMVGRLRDDRLHVFGTRSSLGMRRLFSRQNDSARLNLDFNWTLRSNSDHWTFFERDIPVLLLHTGIHADYHTPRDDAHLIEKQGMQRVTRLMFGTIDALANANRPPTFRAAALGETNSLRKRRLRQRAPLPNRLGCRWSRHADRRDGVMLTRVDAEGPAAAAGLRAGDRVLRLGASEIKSPGDLEGASVTIDRPSQLTYQRRGQAEPSTVTIDPRGKPWRLGFNWIIDPAEPGAAVVTHVVPNTPAARSGLRPGDYIQRFAGHDFAGREELIALAADATQSAKSIALLVEREGRVETIDVHLRDLPPVVGM